MYVLVVSLLIVLADQVSKLLVRGVQIPALGISWAGLPYGTSVPVLGEFFRLTYIENSGMAFGIDVGGKIFFSLFSLFASIALVVYLHRVRTAPLGFRLSLAMILGGAVGNLIDRMFYGIMFGYAPLFGGRVVDFFDVDFFTIDLFGYHLSRFWVFNVADASVTLGVVLLMLFHRVAVSEDTHVPPPPSTERPVTS
jgi:signal peptidase II